MAPSKAKENVLNAALKLISGHVESVSDPTENPEQYIRDIHRQWRGIGGRVAGKPRHSERYLDDRLREANKAVRSLNPKLLGRTRMRPKDASNLVSLMLTFWPAPGSGDDENIAYKPFLSENEIGAVSEFVENQVALIAELDAPEPDFDSEQPDLPGETIAGVMAHHYRESNALIIVSPVQILVSSGPGTEFLGFREVIDRLRAEDEADNTARPVIWILDLGGLKLDDLSTRRKFSNVYSLQARFKALRRFEDGSSNKRWQWLLSRGVIVILDNYYGREEQLSAAARPEFSSHHVSLTNINPDWLKSPNFRALYGSELEKIDARAFTVFYNITKEWPSSPALDSDVRYFGYATFVEEKTKIPYGRGLELPTLPVRYSDAAKAVCNAAAHLLRTRSAPALTESDKRSLDALAIDGDKAIQQLRYLGYRALLLDKFLDEY